MALKPAFRNWSDEAATGGEVDMFGGSMLLKLVSMCWQTGALINAILIDEPCKNLA